MARADAAQPEPPVVAVIGDVVALAERLAWFEPSAPSRAGRASAFSTR